MGPLIEDRTNRKIVEVRDLTGFVKVVGAWFGWDVLFSFSIEIFLTFLLEKGIIRLESSTLMTIRGSLAAIITTLFMQIRMSKKAKQRWIDNQYKKY